MTDCDVAIIGAGPYGLSIAAHLKERGVDFRIFGRPMGFWLTHMPKGMRLKSEGFASSLYDPHSTFTLEAYCKEKGLPYAKIALPVPLEVFSSYGLEFQKRMVPELEPKLVTSIKRAAEGFQIRLEDGETLTARRVVMATGLANYENMPPVLAALPAEFATHGSKHHDLESFRGRDVAVVGAGASALDIAALLHEIGARVQVIARKERVRFQDAPESSDPSWLDQLRAPVTGIGPGWKLWLCTNAPLVFRRMPVEFRLDKVRRILGPAPCWFIKEQVEGKIPMTTGVTITEAKVQNGRVNLRLTDSSGKDRFLTADHVIAATGYRVDVRRLPFLDRDFQDSLKCVENTPALSSNFESSVPGLYFVGIASANTFGPMLRFAFGAGFASKRISKHLAKTADRPAQSRTQTRVETADRGELVAQ